MSKASRLSNARTLGYSHQERETRAVDPPGLTRRRARHSHSAVLVNEAPEPVLRGRTCLIPEQAA